MLRGIKVFLVFILFFFLKNTVYSQVPTDTSALRVRINQWIIPNGQKQITATQLNYLMNGIAQLMKAYAIDSAKVSNDTLYLIRRGGFTTYALKIPGHQFAGNNQEIQFKLNGVPAASPSLKFDSTLGILQIGTGNTLPPFLFGDGYKFGLVFGTGNNMGFGWGRGIMVGDNNITQNSERGIFIFGNNNLSHDGGKKIVFGDNHTVRGVYQAVFGEQNTGSQWGLNAGRLNIANGATSYSGQMQLGQGLWSQSLWSMTVGQYNDTAGLYIPNGDNAKFAVGIGTAGNNRKNGFVVLGSGKTILPFYKNNVGLDSFLITNTTGQLIQVHKSTMITTSALVDTIYRTPGIDSIYWRKNSVTYAVKDSAGGGSGSVTSVGLSMPTGFVVTNSPVTSTGTLTVTTSLNGILIGNGTGFSTATVSSPLVYSSGTLSIPDAVANGTTKGVSAFTTNDFNDNGAGIISLDITNAQKATTSQPGFLTSADWNLFNAKENPLTFSTGLTRTTNTITNNLSTGVSGGQSAIGSTSTNSGLTFQTTTGVGTTGADFIFKGGNNGATEFMRILNNGNVGIGLNNPSTKFEVAGVITQTVDNEMVIKRATTPSGLLGIVFQNSSGVTKAYFRYHDATAETHIGAESGGILSLYANGIEAGRFETTGSFIIGPGANSGTAFIDIKAATTAISSIRIRSSTGVDVSSPNSGDLWWNGTNLYFRTASTTVDLLTGVGGGSGTVTSVSSGNLSPLFTTSVATATTTPAISYTLSNASANTIFGNNTGSSAAPAYFSPILASALFANQGTTTQVLHGNASGNPSWGAINLATDVTGNLPNANLANSSITWASIGTTGTAPAFSTGSTSLGGTATLNIPLASAISVTAGLISKTDYDAFNGKVGSVIGTTNRITITGTSTAPIVDIAGTYIGQTSITTLGTITTGGWQGTVIAPAFGGTGQSSYTVGDLLVASGTTTLTKLSDIAIGNVLLSGGTSTMPSYGKVGLTTHVSGTLPIANGGTNATTANAALNNLLPTQSGNSGKVLTTDATNSSWVFSYTLDRDNVTYSSNQTAGSSDIGKVVFLNGSSSAVNLTVSPTTFNKKIMIIYCTNATNTVKVTPSSGNINGLTEYQLVVNEAITVYSDGTNLFIIQ
jgi:hypothetical protein